jgi:DNA-directed RNA polymerase specialized sigma24 family protein
MAFLSSHESYRSGRQTGGDRKTWVFDPSDAEVEMIPVIRDQLTHYDEYFFEDQGESTLSIVMDKVLEDLPEHIADAVRLVHLRGKSLRSAAKILGVDHKTVKARVDKGVGMMRTRLTDSLWIAEMLRGYIPAEELKSEPVQKNDVASILKTLKDEDNEQE